MAVLLEKADSRDFDNNDVLEALPDATRRGPLEEIFIWLHSAGWRFWRQARRRGQARRRRIGRRGDDVFDLSGVSSYDTVGLYLKRWRGCRVDTEERSIWQAAGDWECCPPSLPGERHRDAGRYRRPASPHRGRQGARDHLIKANTRLVVSIAKSTWGGRAFPRPDSRGHLGLMKAVEKFDYSAATGSAPTDVVDSPDDHARDRGPGPDDSGAGAYVGPHPAAVQNGPPVGAGKRAQTHPGRDRSAQDLERVKSSGCSR